MPASIVRAFARFAIAAAALLATPLVVCVSAQGRVTLSIGTSTALTAPGGADLDAGVSVATTVSVTITNCSHFPCTTFIKTNQASVTFGGTGTPVTELDYCVINCSAAGSWTRVPNTSGDGDPLISFSSNTSSNFQLRYKLGWTGSPFTPPGSYALPILITLKN